MKSAIGFLEDTFGPISLQVLEQHDDSRMSIVFDLEKRLLALNLVEFVNTDLDFHQDVLSGVPISVAIEKNGYRFSRVERECFYFDIALFSEKAVVKCLDVYASDNLYARVIEIYSPSVGLQGSDSGSTSVVERLSSLDWDVIKEKIKKVLV
jgi:hypothetical protein